MSAPKDPIIMRGGEMKQLTALAFRLGAKSPHQVAESVRISVLRGSDPEAAILKLARTRPDLFR